MRVRRRRICVFPDPLSPTNSVMACVGILFRSPSSVGERVVIVRGGGSEDSRAMSAWMCSTRFLCRLLSSRSEAFSWGGRRREIDIGSRARMSAVVNLASSMKLRRFDTGGVRGNEGKRFRRSDIAIIIITVGTTVRGVGR